MTEGQEVASLHVKLSADTADFQRGLQAAKTGLARAAASATISAGHMHSALQMPAKDMTGYATKADGILQRLNTEYQKTGVVSKTAVAAALGNMRQLNREMSTGGGGTGGLAAMAKGWQDTGKFSQMSVHMALGSLKQLAGQAGFTEKEIEKIGRGAQAATAHSIALGERFSSSLRGAGLAAQTMVGQLDAVGQRMQRIGQQMTMYITLPLVGFGVGLVKLASDAVESENLFEVSLDGMADRARAWSEETAKALRLNAYELRRQVGTWDVMLKTFGMSEQAAFDMSRRLTTLAQDMASFYNLSPAEAFQKLQSGIAGEIEPLRRLGISVSETTAKEWALKNGLIATNGEMSESQKVLVRYAVIMEQTSKAQGDLARTADSPANQMRALRAEAEQAGIQIGTVLLPALTTGMQASSRVIADLTSRWKESGDAGQQNILRVAVLLAASGPLVTAAGAAVRAVGAIGSAFLTMGAMARLGVMGAVAALAAVPAWDALQQRSATASYEDYANQLMINTDGAGTPMTREEFARQQAQIRKDLGKSLGEDALDAVFKPVDDYMAQLERAEALAKAKATASGMPADKGTPRTLAEAEQGLRTMTNAASAAQDPLQAIKDIWNQLPSAVSAGKNALNDAADLAREKYSILKDALSAAQSKLQELLNTPLRGQKAMSDKQFGLQRQMTALELQILNIKDSGKATPAKQRQITNLEKQLEKLRIQYEKLRKEEWLAFEPQKRALEDLANPQTEKTFNELAAGITEQRQAIELLEPQVGMAEQAYKELEKALRATERAANDVSTALTNAANAPKPTAPVPVPPLRLVAPVGPTEPWPGEPPISPLPGDVGGGGSGSGGQSRAYANGGWLNEPVVGYGTRSGQGYLLAEKGPEYVGKGGGGLNITAPLIGTVIVQGQADENRLVNRLMDALSARFTQALGQSTRYPLGLSEVS